MRVSLRAKKMEPINWCFKSFRISSWKNEIKFGKFFYYYEKKFLLKKVQNNKKS